MPTKLLVNRSPTLFQTLQLASATLSLKYGLIFLSSHRTAGDVLWCLVSLFQVPYKHPGILGNTISWSLYLIIRPLAQQIVVLSVQPTIRLFVQSFNQGRGMS